MSITGPVLCKDEEPRAAFFSSGCVNLSNVCSIYNQKAGLPLLEEHSSQGGKKIMLLFILLGGGKSENMLVYYYF